MLQLLAHHRRFSLHQNHSGIEEGSTARSRGDVQRRAASSARSVPEKLSPAMHEEYFTGCCRE